MNRKDKIVRSLKKVIASLDESNFVEHDLQVALVLVAYSFCLGRISKLARNLEKDRI